MNTLINNILILTDDHISVSGNTIAKLLFSVLNEYGQNVHVSTLHIDYKNTALDSSHYMRKISAAAPDAIFTIDLAGLYLLNFLETPFLEDLPCPKFHLLCKRPWQYDFLCTWHSSINTEFIVLYPDDSYFYKHHCNIDSIHALPSDCFTIAAPPSDQYTESVSINLEDLADSPLNNLPEYIRTLSELLTPYLEQYDYIHALEHTFQAIDFTLNQEEFILIMKELSFVYDRNHSLQKPENRCIHFSKGHTADWLLQLLS